MRPGIGGGALAGIGPYSAPMVSTWFVFVSSTMVLAPSIVCSRCSTTKLVGLFSLMNTIEPSPAVLMASIVAGLNATVSTFRAVGKVVMMLPLLAFRMITTGVGRR